MLTHVLPLKETPKKVPCLIDISTTMTIRDAASQGKVYPPSTMRSAPVMYEQLSPAKKT